MKESIKINQTLKFSRKIKTIPPYPHIKQGWNKIVL